MTSYLHFLFFITHEWIIFVLKNPNCITEKLSAEKLAEMYLKNSPVIFIDFVLHPGKKKNNFIMKLIST